MVVWINNHYSSSLLLSDCNQLPIKLFLGDEITVKRREVEFDDSFQIAVGDVEYFESFVDTYGD